jgi:hypothetical protein
MSASSAKSVQLPNEEKSMTCDVSRPANNISSIIWGNNNRIQNSSSQRELHCSEKFCCSPADVIIKLIAIP